jgi:hypothetical protein
MLARCLFSALQIAGDRYGSAHFSWRERRLGGEAGEAQ